MFDVPFAPDPPDAPAARLDPDAALNAALSDLLRRPIAVGPRDRCRFLGFGEVTHLGRRRPCGWHLAVHRDRDGGCWTHLYRTVPDGGGTGVLVLLHEAVEGEPGESPRRFSAAGRAAPLPVRAVGCEAAPTPARTPAP